ncbi:MAG: hypothetical protein ACOYUZ_06055 [Patescibacteria group bacterium]
MRPKSLKKQRFSYYLTIICGAEKNHRCHAMTSASSAGKEAGHGKK